jgi:2-methylcitrate dehydratase PrpD
MTIAKEIASFSLAPHSDGEVERLRTLTLANLAAGTGRLGRAGALIDAAPFDRDSESASAFVHAMRTHARTQDDFHPQLRVHIGAVTLAAALGLAENASAPAFDCLTAGYRAMCAVSAPYSVDAQRRGYRPTGVFGPIGAAACASAALGLDVDGTANAMTLAAARSAGTNQSWLSGTDEWLLEVGAAARAGVEAALLTRAGFLGARDAFEGRAGWSIVLFGDARARRLSDSLDSATSDIGSVALKPYPVSGIAQVPTELACRAYAEHGGRALRSAVVRLSPLSVAYPGSANMGPFRSRSDALMSVRFCVACGITEGRVRLGRLEDPNALLDQVARVQLVADASLEEGRTALEVQLDGASFESTASDRDVLYPSWDALSADVAGLASRNESDEPMVAEVGRALADDQPDARSLAHLISEKACRR